MGSDPMAVVDSELRSTASPACAADASVMPTMVSSNTNAPSFMIGERCADFILREAGSNAREVKNATSVGFISLDRYLRLNHSMS